MCSRYAATTAGRMIYAPGNNYTNQLVLNDTFFDPVPHLDEMGGHFSDDPSRCLDCSYKPRETFSFKFPCNSAAGYGGDCNCWDPSQMQWQSASMGVPRVQVRFDRFY